MPLSEERQIEPALIRAARSESGLTTDQAAEAAGISRVAYFRWENVKKGPLRTFNFFKLQRLADKLGKEVEALTTPIEQPLAEEVPA